MNEKTGATATAGFCAVCGVAVNPRSQLCRTHAAARARAIRRQLIVAEAEVSPWKGSAA